jgi:ribosomal protein S18 acetylase RimI-like enzyme
MNVKSLAYQTDLAFPGFDGQIIDRGNYLVILTPSIPSYYWGNYLLFDRPPGPSDFVTWREIFAKEIGSQPNIKHEAFGWDDPSGALGHIKPFQKSGYNLFQYSVMITPEISTPPHFNQEVVVRPVTTDTEWERAALCTASESKVVTEVNDRIKKQMDSWRAVSQDNKGYWYGAFLQDEFVGGLGIYKVGDTAVIDSVVTHPNFRKQGVGRSLVYQACLHALEYLSVEKLLLEADNGSAAKRMYEQLGFETVEQQIGMDTA